MLRHSNTGHVTKQPNTSLIITFPSSSLATLISNFRYFTFSLFLVLLTKPFTHHLWQGSPPQNQLLSCHSQQTWLPAHCWAEGTSPGAVQRSVLFSLKTLKPKFILQHGRAGQEVLLHRVFCCTTKSKPTHMQPTHCTWFNSEHYVYIHPFGSQWQQQMAG